MVDPKDIRIAIIGAGPGGLSAAETLRELGYKNVTIFEKRNRVGGQSVSLTYKTPDNRTIIYEMGSIQPTSSPLLYRYIQECGLHVGKNNLGINHDPDDPVYLRVYRLRERKFVQDFLNYKFGVPLTWTLISDLFRLGLSVFKYRKLDKPGFCDISDKHLKELAIPYEQWIEEKNFHVLKEMLINFGSVITFSNPASKENLCALEMVKFFLSLIRLPYNRMRYLNGQFKLVREGYQELWNRMGKKHHVLLNANITKIHRRPVGIEIDLGTEKHTFDKLIVTCSLKEANHFLDVTEEEKSLFGKVHHFPGWRVAFLGKNLPHDAIYFLNEPCQDSKYPPVMQTFYPEGEVGNGIWLYTGLVNFNKSEQLEPVLKYSEKILKEHFNGEVIEWLDQVYWPEYGINYSFEEVRNGVYRKLENLQGKNNTYYMGMCLAFGSHGLVVEYSEDRIKKHFK